MKNKKEYEYLGLIQNGILRLRTKILKNLVKKS